MASFVIGPIRRSLLQACLCALLSTVAVPALAQNIPNEAIQEVVIKSSLVTFSDANLTGNYAVLNAMGSKPFRDGLSADKLKDAFKVFAEKQIDLSPVVSAKIVATKPTTVDSDGVMVTEGYLDTPRIRVIYTLKHLLSDGRWKLLGINVKTDEVPK